jgi:protein gp37
MISIVVKRLPNIEWFVVAVNGTTMCERPNHNYANDKAMAFAKRLAADGHDVSVKLYQSNTASNYLNKKAA